MSGQLMRCANESPKQPYTVSHWPTTADHCKCEHRKVQTSRQLLRERLVWLRSSHIRGSFAVKALENLGKRWTKRNSQIRSQRNTYAGPKPQSTSNRRSLVRGYRRAERGFRQSNQTGLLGRTERPRMPGVYRGPQLDACGQVMKPQGEQR